MLDFYLTNAPLHSVAQENSQDEILDWKIRATVNGENFTIDQWQPIYLKGFKPGKNWVQLELIDERGNPVKNAFNNTVRLITYEPLGQDFLSKIVRGELTAAAARGTVDRTYKPETPKPTPTPEPQPTPALEKTPVTEPSLEKTVAPEVAPVQVIEPKPTATPQLEAPKVIEPIQVTEPTPTATPELESPKVVEQVKVIEPKPTATPQLETPKVVAPVKIIEPTPTASPQTKKQEYKGYYNRFRNFLRQEPEPATPSEPPTLPEITEKAPVPKAVAPAIPEQSPNLVPPAPPVAPETPSQPTADLAAPEKTVAEPENQPKSEQKVEFAT
jgi:hypothetical protein